MYSLDDNCHYYQVDYTCLLQILKTFLPVIELNFKNSSWLRNQFHLYLQTKIKKHRNYEQNNALRLVITIQRRLKTITTN